MATKIQRVYYRKHGSEITVMAERQSPKTGVTVQRWYHPSIGSASRLADALSQKLEKGTGTALLSPYGYSWFSPQWNYVWTSEKIVVKGARF